VIRSSVATDEPPGVQMIAVHFEKPARRVQRKLSETIERYGSGPATLEGRDVLAAGDGGASRAAAASSATAAKSQAAHRPVATPAPAHESGAAAGNGEGSPTGPGGGNGRDRACGAEPPAADRRGAPRHGLERPGIALGEEATKVLMGRDISLGGMRVGVAPGLSVGDLLQLALHVRAREAPLVVRAEVTRDEGENGLALAFRDLDESSRGCLESMVKFLPILAARDGDSDEAVIVSEILEHIDG